MRLYPINEEMALNNTDELPSALVDILDSYREDPSCIDDAPFVGTYAEIEWQGVGVFTLYSAMVSMQIEEEDEVECIGDYPPILFNGDYFLSSEITYHLLNGGLSDSCIENASPLEVVKTLVMLREIFFVHGHSLALFVAEDIADAHRHKLVTI